MKILKLGTFALSGAMLFASCEKAEDTATPEATKGELEVTLAGFEPLASDLKYEGWVIIDGKPVTTGTFDGVDGGASVTKTMTFEGDKTKVTSFVVSIEPAVDPDPAPSVTKIVAGDFKETAGTKIATAGLTFDLGDAAGSTFILKTPSTASNDDENSGVWFLTLDGGPKATLKLPKLAEGWKYEGWAVVGGTPYSTGKFADPAAADLSGEKYKGDGNVPPLPGEDFIQGRPNFPLVIAAESPIVISIEPDVEKADDVAPFFMKPLAKMVSADDITKANADAAAGTVTNISMNFTPVTVSAVATVK